MNAQVNGSTGHLSSRGKSASEPVLGPAEPDPGDRAYLQPDRIAHVLAEGGDVIIRAGWRNARWLDGDGEQIDIIEELVTARNKAVLDIDIQIGRKGADPIKGLRLVALRKTPEATKAACEKARADARKGGHKLAPETLVAAEWMILVTSLAREDFPACDIAALYRLRWRIELAFKRLKSLIRFKGPPGKDEALARTFLLAHLLLAVLIGLSSSELLDSPP